MLRWLRRSNEGVSWERACRRAARGAAYLDVVDPGWYRQVDLDQLELADGHLCVLGQRYGAFFLGLTRVGLLNFSSAPLGSLSPVDYGFLCVQGVDEAVQMRDYALLNRAWRREIQQRLERDTSAAENLAEFAGAAHKRQADSSAHE